MKHILRAKWGCHMVRLASQVLIATARALAGMGVVDEAERVADSATDALGRGGSVGAVPSWNARFVQHCGFWAMYDHRLRESAWPFPQGLTLRELSACAKLFGVVHEEPEPGDLFLMYSPVERTFVHTGVIVEVLAYAKTDKRRCYWDLYTIEADTNDVGQMAGGKTMRVRRRLWPSSGDRFIRWASLVRDEDMGVSFLRSA